MALETQGEIPERILYRIVEGLLRLSCHVLERRTLLVVGHEPVHLALETNPRLSKLHEPWVLVELGLEIASSLLAELGFEVSPVISEWLEVTSVLAEFGLEVCVVFGELGFEVAAVVAERLETPGVFGELGLEIVADGEAWVAGRMPVLEARAAGRGASPAFLEDLQIFAYVKKSIYVTK